MNKQVPVHRPRPCKRCGILTTRVDRCGWCPICQWEFANERIYINWQAFTGLWEARGWTWAQSTS